MELCTSDDTAIRQPRPGAPVVTAWFGAEGDDPGLAVVQVVVAPGSAMPAHRHNGSDIVLVALAGRVEIAKDDEFVTVAAGDAVFIGADEAVSLANTGDDEARLIVAAAPASFVSHVREWPEPQTA